MVRRPATVLREVHRLVVLAHVDASWMVAIRPVDLRSRLTSARESITHAGSAGEGTERPTGTEHSGEHTRHHSTGPSKNLLRRQSPTTVGRAVLRRPSEPLHPNGEGRTRWVEGSVLCLSTDRVTTTVNGSCLPGLQRTPVCLGYSGRGLLLDENLGKGPTPTRWAEGPGVSRPSGVTGDRCTRVPDVSTSGPRVWGSRWRDYAKWLRRGVGWAKGTPTLPSLAPGDRGRECRCSSACAWRSSTGPTTASWTAGTSRCTYFTSYSLTGVVPTTLA